uniref:Uncharacterized protein n=1 Tax=Rhizophora mucronata TaxID=61149 RepID=A0A2P2R3M9_RHIMU
MNMTTRTTMRKCL